MAIHGMGAACHNAQSASDCGTRPEAMLIRSGGAGNRESSVAILINHWRRKSLRMRHRLSKVLVLMDRLVIGSPVVTSLGVTLEPAREKRAASPSLGRFLTKQAFRALFSSGTTGANQRA